MATIHKARLNHFSDNRTPLLMTLPQRDIANDANGVSGLQQALVIRWYRITGGGKMHFSL
jgi:hypothetical protein